MLELVLVLIVIGILAGFAAAAMAFTATLVAAVGFFVLWLGLVVGVPTGLWYHLLLYRTLTPKMALPRRWWWAPAQLHRHLTEAERRRIAVWNRAGGIGFVLCVVGGLTALTGLLLGR